jgi:hypothetical protein
MYISGKRKENTYSIEGNEIKKNKNKIFIYSTDNKLWNTYENKILANLNNEMEYEYLFFEMGILGITCFLH